MSKIILFKLIFIILLNIEHMINGQLKFWILFVLIFRFAPTWVNNHRLFKNMVILIGKFIIGIWIRIEIIKCSNIHTTCLSTRLCSVYSFSYTPNWTRISLTHLRIPTHYLIILIIYWLIIRLLIQTVLYVLHWFSAYSYSLLVLSL